MTVSVFPYFLLFFLLVNDYLQFSFQKGTLYTSLPINKV